MSEKILRAILEQLASDADTLGASEVLIGHPQESIYTFRVFKKCEKHYTGTLSEEVYRSLLKRFYATPRIPQAQEVSQNSLQITSLHIALTRNFEKPVFCLTWKKQQCKKLSPKETTRATAPESPKTKQKILLIDDDLRFCFVLGKILEEKGFAIESKSGGKAALEHIKTHIGNGIPDLAICDVHMPHMDGEDFLRELRALDLPIPVLMLTSDEDSVLEAELAMLGADAFMRKQEDPKVLLAWCHNLLHRKTIGTNRLQKQSEEL